MSDNASSGPARVSTASAPVFVATLAAVILAIGAFLSLDLFLARIDRAESAARAASEYTAGIQLLRAGRIANAAGRFGAAAAIERSNVNYALALGEAMLEEGKVAEAEATLRSLLERAENDGAVNLTMAHVMARENRWADAKAYYHRAIFGRWGADSAARRTQARFELIELLARRGAPRELLAELLPLEETPSDSVALRKRLGELFIAAGSPARAANMLRDVLRRDPNDAEAYATMGEAALALGNFRTAQADFAEAARLRPSDDRIARRVAIADTVLALDPMARGVTPAQRFARSRLLLIRTLTWISECHAPRSVRSDSAMAMIGRIPNARTRELMGDAMLELAADFWAAKPASCTLQDEPLRLLHARIAQ